MPPHALANRVQDFVGGAHADVGAHQRVLEFVQQVGVDLLLALERIFQRGDQSGARFFHAALQPVKQRGFLFNRAEQRLDHFSSVYQRVKLSAFDGPSARMPRARKSSPPVKGLRARSASHFAISSSLMPGMSRMIPGCTVLASNSTRRLSGKASSLSLGPP